MRRNCVLLDEPILFILQFDCDIVIFCNLLTLIWHSLYFELLDYFCSLGFFLLDLLHDFCLITLLTKISKLAHCFIKHREELISLQVKVVL